MRRATASFSLAALLSSVAVASSYVLLAPCRGCLYDVLPVAAAGFVSLASALLARSRPSPGAVRVGFLAVAALLGWGAWVGACRFAAERGLVPPDPACSSAADQGAAFDGLMGRFLGAPFVPCDRPTAFLLGVSFAGWQALLCLGAAGWSLRRASTYRTAFRDDARSAIASSTVKGP